MKTHQYIASYKNGKSFRFYMEQEAGDSLKLINELAADHARHLDGWGFVTNETGARFKLETFSTLYRVDEAGVWYVSDENATFHNCVKVHSENN